MSFDVDKRFVNTKKSLCNLSGVSELRLLQNCFYVSMYPLTIIIYTALSFYSYPT